MDLRLLHKIVCASAAALFAFGHSHAEPPPGDYTLTLKHGGRERSYILHVPKDALTNPWPVVINFHGSGSSAAGQQAYSRIDAIAHREGFLVVYPNGTDGIADYLSKVLGSQRKVLGPATDVIDANTQMWEFFALHRKFTIYP